MSPSTSFTNTVENLSFSLEKKNLILEDCRKQLTQLLEQVSTLEYSVAESKNNLKKLSDRIESTKVDINNSELYLEQEKKNILGKRELSKNIEDDINKLQLHTQRQMEKLNNIENINTVKDEISHRENQRDILIRDTQVLQEKVMLMKKKILMFVNKNMLN